MTTNSYYDDTESFAKKGLRRRKEGNATTNSHYDETKYLENFVPDLTPYKWRPMRDNVENIFEDLGI